MSIPLTGLLYGMPPPLGGGRGGGGYGLTNFGAKGTCAFAPQLSTVLQVSLRDLHTLSMDDSTTACYDVVL